MYLSTTLAALLAAVTMTASATPVLDARQETPRIYARFFGGGGCQEPWLEDTVFLQTVPVGECQDVTVGPFGSTNFAQNLLTRTLRFYDLPCSADEESGNHFDIAPGDGATPGCRAQAIRSYKVL